MAEVLEIPNIRISLSPNLSQMLEKIILIRFWGELVETAPISNELFGFKTGPTTDYQLLQITEVISDKFIKKEMKETVFLNLAKVIDTICQKGFVRL